MIAIQARELVVRHHKYAWAFMGLAILVVGGVFFRKEITQAATFTFTQSSWAGGTSATVAKHLRPDNGTDQTGWTYSSSTSNVTAGATVTLPSTSYAFIDDVATSSSPTSIASGGGFSSSGTATSSTVVSAGSVTLQPYFNGGTGSNGAVNISGTGSCSSVNAVLTGTRPTCSIVGNTYNFTTFNIASGSTLNVTGTSTQPLILYATGAVTIAGTISANGGLSNGGPGGYNGGAAGVSGSGPIANSGGPGVSSNYGGGGASAGAGSAGWNGSGWTNPGGSATYNLANTGGAGGGGGGTGIVGGGGGGSVAISSAVSISVTGAINANGAGCGNSCSGGGGGRISLLGSTINIGSATTSLTASGGSVSSGNQGAGGGGGSIFLQYGSLTGSLPNVPTGGTTNGGPAGGVGARATSTPIYYSSGTFTSAIINLGAQAAFTTLGWTETLPAQTALTMKARSSANSDMSGATAWGSCSNITKNANLSTGGCVTDGHQYVQYQATLSTSNTAVTPTLDSVTIGYNQYTLSGDITSSFYDIGSNAVISKISWTAATSTNETVRFQIRSSADGNTWTNWCGFADTGTTCTGTNYFTDAHNNLAISDVNHPLRSGSGVNADRYFQYKAYLASGGSLTPTLSQVVVQYVVNAPPEVQNVTAVQNANGTVTVGYEVRDIDSAASGSVTPNAVNVTLQYCTTGSCVVGSDTGWSNATAVTGDVGAGVSVLTGTGAGTAWSTGKTITWTPATDYSAQYNTAQKIRIKANDSEGANNLGYAVPVSGFVLDTKVPVVSYVRVDSSATNNPVTWSVADDTTLSYRLSNSAFASYTSNEAAWTATTTGANGVDWPTLAGTPGTETVYYQFRDAYGNGVSGTAVAPATPSNFLMTDTTNNSTNTYREFLSWGVASPSGFGSYKVYSNTTGAGSPYSLIGTIPDYAQNYYTDTIVTATTSVHYYKIVAVNTNGDVSEFSSVKSDIPDGSGSTDVTPPYIPVAGIAVTPGNISANITLSTYTDISLAQGELATSTVRYASYVGQAPTSCPSANSVSTATFTVNHSVYLTGLTPSTHYVFCVVARDIAGNTSTATSVAVSGGTFTTTGGPVITGVTERQVSDVSATIFWNTDTSSDSKVYYATTAGGVNGATPVTGPVVTTSGTNANGTFYQHQIGLTGLTAGQTYYFKVSSTDTAGIPLTTTDNNNGQYYSFVTLKDTTPPTISATSTPVLASDSAVIVWQTDELATSQVFYDIVSRGGNTAQYAYRTAQQSPMSIFHVMTLSSATEKYDNSGNSLILGGNVLTPEKTYYTAVQSVDAAGNHTSSTEWSFTTPSSGTVTIIQLGGASKKQEGPDVDAPVISGVKVFDITPFGATVSFGTDEDTDGFVKYGKDTSYGQVFGDDAWSKDHTIKLHGLTVGAEYHFKVVAHDKAGNTGASNDQTFKTTFLSEDLKDLAKIENIEAFQKEIENTIESILPSLVPPFVSKPMVTDITESSATISFRTNIKSFPIVAYVEQGVYDDTKENPYVGEASNTETKSTEHEIKLTGLKPNTKYHYQARAFSLPKVIGKSADLTFITKAAKIAGSIVERKKDSFTVVWVTDEPTTSIVEYKNMRNGVTERKVDAAMKTSHSMKIENLPSGTTYEVDISGLTESGNVVESGSHLSVTTSTDTTAPTISGFKVDNALVPGRTDRIQTIVSWDTDEPANSLVFYEEGAGTAGETQELANKIEALDSYTMKHSVILPNLKPGTIYRLKVDSSDDSGNLGSFGPRTVITPRQTESITDIIFKNFEDSFKFLRQI